MRNFFCKNFLKKTCKNTIFLAGDAAKIQKLKKFIIAPKLRFPKRCMCENSQGFLALKRYVPRQEAGNLLREVSNKEKPMHIYELKRKARQGYSALNF